MFQDRYGRANPAPFIVGGGVILAGLGIVAMLATGSCNAYNGTLARYDVTGEVKAPPQGKTFGGGDTKLTTKFSIRLQTEQGEVIVNCDSTQCASLNPGDNVLLSCFEEWHLTEPNEQECRFDKLLSGADPEPLPK